MNLKLTFNQVKTLQKCKENPTRFLKFCTILGPSGDQEFKPFRWQKKVLKSFKETAFDPKAKRGHVLIAPRQSGKTTLIAAYALWYALFHNDRNVCLMARKWAQANEIMLRVKEIFRKLPEYMRLDTKLDRKEIMQFTNNSRIFSCSANSAMLHGRTIDLFVIDEAAYIDDSDFEELMMCILPVMMSRKDAQTIFLSTPQKKETTFYKIYEHALDEKNSWVPHRVKWNCRPERSKEWLETAKKNFDKDQFRCEILADFI